MREWMLTKPIVVIILQCMLNQHAVHLKLVHRCMVNYLPIKLEKIFLLFFLMMFASLYKFPAKINPAPQ